MIFGLAITLGYNSVSQCNEWPLHKPQKPLTHLDPSNTLEVVQVSEREGERETDITVSPGGRESVQVEPHAPDVVAKYVGLLCRAPRHG